MGNVVREEVLKAGVLEIGQFHHAGDQPGIKVANNKLEFNNLLENARALHTVARYLGGLASKYEPDTLLGVPSGGVDLCHAINLYSDVLLPLVELKKIENEASNVKTFDFLDFHDEDILDQAKRLVIIEDVFNTFASTRGVLAVAGVTEKAVAAIAVWDRGFHPSRIPLEFVHEALVSEYIPRTLHENDALYKRARHIA